METKSRKRSSVPELVEASAPSVQPVQSIAPLSEDEERAWSRLVEEGRAIRAPLLERREAERAEREEARRMRVEAKGRKYVPWKRRPSSAYSDAEAPVGVKRWIVSRAAGLSWNRACASCGVVWLDIQNAKAVSEDCRCAFAAMEESSRQLMKAKAHSVVEGSQDEGAKVSMAQTQVSMKILSCLDRDHFGEDVQRRSDERPRSSSGGGFVINLVQDAASAAQAVPAVRPGKALVYADV